MKSIYQNIIYAKQKKQPLLAILIDPEKTTLEHAKKLISKIKQSPATHIFVGGSTFSGTHLDDLISYLKTQTQLPILLFPGHPSQISKEADAVLFLSLLSGRNSDYLIGHQVNAVESILSTDLEVIPTGYILVDGGKETAVQRVSQTKPIEHDNLDVAFKTAKAGEFLGKKLIYLEAGSGAINRVSDEMIAFVSQNISIPLLVGGGIRSKDDIDLAYQSGADLVVIGTAFEDNPNFFEKC